MARMSTAHHRENAGEREGAIKEASKGLALVGDDDGPWLGALLHTLLAGSTPSSASTRRPPSTRGRATGARRARGQ